MHCVCVLACACVCVCLWSCQFFQSFGTIRFAFLCQFTMSGRGVQKKPASFASIVKRELADPQGPIVKCELAVRQGPLDALVHTQPVKALLDAEFLEVDIWKARKAGGLSVQGNWQCQRTRRLVT